MNVGADWEFFVPVLFRKGKERKEEGEERRKSGNHECWCRLGVLRFRFVLPRGQSSPSSSSPSSSPV